MCGPAATHMITKVYHMANAWHSCAEFASVFETYQQYLFHTSFPPKPPWSPSIYWWIHWACFIYTNITLFIYVGVGDVGHSVSHKKHLKHFLKEIRLQYSFMVELAIVELGYKIYYKI